MNYPILPRPSVLPLRRFNPYIPPPRYTRLRGVHLLPRCRRRPHYLVRPRTDFVDPSLGFGVGLPTGSDPAPDFTDPLLAFGVDLPPVSDLVPDSTDLSLGFDVDLPVLSSVGFLTTFVPSLHSTLDLPALVSVGLLTVFVPSLDSAHGLPALSPRRPSHSLCPPWTLRLV